MSHHSVRRPVSAPGSPQPAGPPTPARRHQVWWWLRRIGLTVLTLLLIEYLAVPKIVHATSDLTLLADASPVLLVIAFVLESCSWVSYSALSLAVLAPATRPAFLVQFRIDLTGQGVSHVVPGGGASAAALRFRLMTRRAVPGREAASAAAIQTAVSAVGLAATFVAGVVLAGPEMADHPGYATAGALSAVGLIAAAVAMWWLARRRRSMVAPSDPTPHRPGPHRILGRRLSGWVARLVDNVIAVLRRTSRRAMQLTRDPRRGLAVLGWATANWVFDAACLWVCLKAYHLTLHPGPLLAAYGAANLIGLLPVTPGGLGVVEGLLIPALVGLGDVGAAPVTLGVLTWRLLQFWLPIPIAGLAYLSLRIPARTGHG